MLGNINDVLEMQAQCRSVAVSRGVNTSHSGNNRKDVGMDYFMPIYLLICLFGTMLMFALMGVIDEIQPKGLRIAIRLGMIFAFPLVLVVAFFMYVFEIELKQ